MLTEDQIDKILEEYQIVYIDGIPLNDPKPSPPYAFSKKEQDLDSGVNLEGYMERNVLEHHRRTLTLKFPSMNGTQMMKLLNILDKPTLHVKAFDPWINGLQEKEMEIMHGDLSPTLYGFDWDYENECVQAVYEEFTVQLVEY